MDASYDTWKVVSLSPLGPWVLFGLGAALAVGVGLACWGVRGEPQVGRRWLLWVLRVMAGLCALFLLLEPGLRRLQIARVKNRVAVLVDRSASMGFPSESGGVSRTVAVADLLDRLTPQMAAVRDQYAFDVFGFAPELSPLTSEVLRGEPPQAGHTDLLSALKSAAAGDQGSARKLSGVLLLSDGADNAELKSGLPARAQSALAQLGVPVSTAAVGREGLRDLSIEGIKVDDFAFVRNSMTAEVELRARGLSGETVQVVLRRDGQTVATKSVALSGDDDATSVSFSFTPDQTGRFVYTVAVPVFPGEAVAENNTRSFSLKVIRDRVRVLLVAGRPTWDERFLRGLLRQDANVEVISFYILRHTSDETGTWDDQRELSLIPFPREEIFRSKIHTFDLIIVLNFGQEDSNIALSGFQEDIKRYVLNGGALAYVGGDRSFGESQGQSPFTDVLPVDAAGPADLQPFKPRLTPEGLRHPITALGSTGQSAEGAWEALPAIQGINLTRPKAGATVLLEHPWVTVDGRNAPLVALWEHGRGRALALMSDATWYWAFPAHAGGATARSYERFWSSAIRWLVRDPDLTALGLTADPPSVEPGRPVGAVVVARLPDYQPAAGASATVDLISADDGGVVARQTGTAGSDGVVRLEFPPVPPGPYKLVARASRGDKSLGETTDAVAVRAVGPELADARVNASLLEAIASATGGRHFRSLDFALDDLPLLEAPLVEVGRSQDLPIWDRWYWLLLAVFLMGLEWALRRRFGYI